MTVTDFDEAQHPRDGSGQFTSRPAAESSGTDLPEDPVDVAYARADEFGARADAAVNQIAELRHEVDADSCRELGVYLQLLAPGATHARLERYDDRWHFDGAVDADGGDIHIDRECVEWAGLEDGIDTAVLRMSPVVGGRPPISFGHDDSIGNGDTRVIALDPDQER